AKGKTAIESLEMGTEPHATEFRQELSRGDNISRTCVRIAVNARERRRKLRLGARLKQRFDGLDGTQAHAGRTSPGKKAEDHLAPQIEIGARSPNILKFKQLSADLIAPCPVSRSNYVDSDRFFGTFPHPAG